MGSFDPTQKKKKKVYLGIYILEFLEFDPTKKLNKNIKSEVNITKNIIRSFLSLLKKQITKSQIALKIAQITSTKNYPKIYT